MPFDDRLTGVPTPARLYALCKLISLKRLEKEELKEYIQPKSLNSKQNAFEEVFSLANKGKLISETVDKKIILILKESDVTTSESFRKAIARRVFTNHELIFCRFSSWYLMRGRQIYSESLKVLATSFDEEVNTSQNMNIYNDTNLNGWRTWAAFLGLGYVHKGVLVPNVHMRLSDVLDQEKSIQRGIRIPFRDFMEWLKIQCPEMDYGEIAESNKGNAQNQNQFLSVALSAGLRTLHDTGKVKLIYTSDTRDTWYLTKAITHDIPDKISELIVEGR